MNVDKIICLGDLVDGGPDPLGVIHEIKARGIASVRGNHDVCNMDNLPESEQKWLDSLPDELQLFGCYYTHVSPRRVRVNKVRDEIEAWNVFEECAERRIFVGHTHLSAIFGKNSNHPTMSAITDFKFNQWVDLDASDRYIISVWAIGYSRDSRKTMRYGVYDDSGDRIMMCELCGPLIQ